MPSSIPFAESIHSILARCDDLQDFRAHEMRAVCGLVLEERARVQRLEAEIDRIRGVVASALTQVGVPAPAETPVYSYPVTEDGLRTLRQQVQTDSTLRCQMWLLEACDMALSMYLTDDAVRLKLADAEAEIRRCHTRLEITEYDYPIDAVFEHERTIERLEEELSRLRAEVSR